MSRLSPPARRRLWLSCLLLLLMIGILIRQWPDRSLWYDETVNAYFATRSWADIWEWCTEIDNQVPLHFVLLKLWASAAGASEFALRAFSFGSGVLALAGVIALGRRMGGHAAAGWLAALALTFSRGFVYAAFEVRAYALALALLAWSSVMLWELWERYADPHRPLDRGGGLLLAAYLLPALAMIYTHYTGFFVLAAHGLYVGWRTLVNPSRRRWAILASLAAGLVIGYLPWLIALAGRDVRAGTAYAGQVEPRAALQTYLDFYAYGQHLLPDIPYAMVILVMLGAALALWGLLQRHCFAARKGMGFVLLMLLVPLVGLALMVYGVQAKLSGRHGWPVWIAMSLLLGLGLAALTRFRWLRWPVWAGALLLIALPASAHLQPIYNSYLREAFAYIEQHDQPGDVLILRDGTLFTAAGYYQASVPWIGLPPDKLTDVNRFLFFPEAADRIERLVVQHDARRVWVLAWQGHIMDPQDVIAGILETIGQPQPLPGAFGFGDVSLSLYTLREDRSIPDLRAAVAALQAGDPAAQTPNGGPVYLGGAVLDKRPFRPGDVLVLHTWWMRSRRVLPGLRVSLRLYPPGAAANEYYRSAALDQPPVSASFGQEHWPPGIPIFSRFLLWIPYDIPPGEVDMQMVIYDVPLPGTFEPVFVPIDRIEIAGP